MQSCIFPQELVDYILDFLYDDPNTLKNCSLVCQAYLPTCRIHIFRRVCFPRRGGAACQRFHGLLEDVPSIIPLVRDLQILNGGSMWGMEEWPETIDPWISAEGSLPRVLTTLQIAGNLKALSIVLRDVWTALPSNLRTSLRALLQLPSLTEVDLMDCSFGSVSNLDALFSNCSGLKRVKLSQITFHNNDIGTIEKILPHAQHSDRTRLECLTILDSNISDTTSWVLHPQAAVDVTSLRKLRSSVDPSNSREFSLFEKFLEMLRNSLEHLHLQFIYGSIHGTSPCINVNHHHLRSLRLSFDIAPDLDPLPWVTHFFSQIKSDHIHEIVIDLRLDHGDEPFLRETFLSLPWDDLDIALSRSAFLLLQRVDVTIFSSPGSFKYTADGEWAVDDVKGLFPRLASRGILSVYGLVYEKSWFYYWPGPTWHASS